jgi:hypothetical protein
MEEMNYNQNGGVNTWGIYIVFRSIIGSPIMSVKYYILEEM